MQLNVLPIFLAIGCIVALAIGLLVLANLINPGRPGGVKQMPYESGMDPIHDTRRRFNVRFYLIAIAFLVFDVELLFLYPWAVAFSARSSPATAVGAADRCLWPGWKPIVFSAPCCLVPGLPLRLAEGDFPVA